MKLFFYCILINLIIFIHAENLRSDMSQVINADKFSESVEVTQYIKGLVLPQSEAKNYEIYAGEIEIGKTVIFENFSCYEDDLRGAKNRMFYQLISAENKPIKPKMKLVEQEDIPLILWMQGGPGASGQFGNIVEMGPYFIDKTKEGKIHFKVNKDSWCKDYYMLFIDSPIGAGLSTFVNPDGTYGPTETNKLTNSTDQAVAVVENFLIKFFDLYPQFQNQPFYIFGESFGGHYIPALTARLLEPYVGGFLPAPYQTARNNIKKQLRGMGIGDLFTNLREQADVYHTYLQSAGLISTWRTKLYQKLSGEIIEDILNEKFTNATNKFFIYDGAPVADSKANITKTNLYNYRKYGEYDAEKYLPELMKTTEFQRAYGIPAAIANNFAFGRDELYLEFSENLPTSYSNNITQILNSGKVKVLLYQGQNDLDVPIQGVNKMLMTIQWPNMQQWRKSPKVIWEECDEKLYCKHFGWKKCYAQFSFAMINDAGHLVPAEQGYSSKDLVDDFINDKICVL